VPLHLGEGGRGDVGWSEREIKERDRPDEREIKERGIDQNRERSKREREIKERDRPERKRESKT